MNSRQTCKAVIFDLYGTLVDYLPTEEYAQCHLHIAAVLDIPVEEMRRVWNQSIGKRYAGEFSRYEDCLVYLCERLGRQATAEQIRKATDIRLDLIRRNLHPRDGAIEVLSHLRSAGFRLGIISDCVPEVRRVWHETPFAELIHEAVFSPEVGVTKPDRRPYIMACEKLGVSPDQCLYVGDGGSHELSGAQEAGMHPVLIRADADGVHIPKRPDADGWDGPVITDLRQVLSMIRLQL